MDFVFFNSPIAAFITFFSLNLLCWPYSSPYVIFSPLTSVSTLLTYVVNFLLFCTCQLFFPSWSFFFSSSHVHPPFFLLYIFFSSFIHVLSSDNCPSLFPLMPSLPPRLLWWPLFATFMHVHSTFLHDQFFIFSNNVHSSLCLFHSFLQSVIHSLWPFFFFSVSIYSPFFYSSFYIHLQAP